MKALLVFMGAALYSVSVKYTLDSLRYSERISTAWSIGIGAVIYWVGLNI